MDFAFSEDQEALRAGVRAVLDVECSPDALRAFALADEAGMTLIQMAIAFVTRHPAVTSAIIGPRTMEHLDSYLAADGIRLSNDLLDRIDQIVPPGVTINVADNMWDFGTTALDPAFRRR